MDIKKLANSIFIHELPPTLSQIELFAQKIREARDAEWMVEPVAYVEWTLDEASWYLTYSKAEENQRQEPLFKKPKEVK